MPVSAHDVAALLLRRTGPVSAMKLQKLVYYSQAWHLARHREPLFTEDIQAWARGPVVPDLYERHRGTYDVAGWRWGDAAAVTGPARATVEWVAAEYGRFSPECLSEMTHTEVPWLVARVDVADGEPSSATIDPRMMTEFHARQRLGPDAAVELATASAALEGVVLGDEAQQQLFDVAHGHVDVGALVEQERRAAAGADPVD